MISTHLARVFLLLSMLVILAGCVTSEPIKSQTSTDDRPLLFFTLEGGGLPSAPLSIFVDGLPMGNAGDFMASRSGLMVLPGTHVVEVRQAGLSIYKEKIFVGSGTNKTIPLNLN